MRRSRSPMQISSGRALGRCTTRRVGLSTQRSWRSSKPGQLPSSSDEPCASEDRVRAVIHNFNRDGFSSLSPKYAGGRPHKFDAQTRTEIARVALTRPKTVGKPYTRWSLTKLADYLVEAGVVDDISTESIRRILDAEGVSYQRLKTWKESNDPHYEAKKNLVWALVKHPPEGSRVISFDEFGPITCEPQPGRGWARRSHPRRHRGNYHKPHGVAYWLGWYDLATDQLYGRFSRRKRIPDILAAAMHGSLRPPRAAPTVQVPSSVVPSVTQATGNACCALQSPGFTSSGSAMIPASINA